MRIDDITNDQESGIMVGGTFVRKGTIFTTVMNARLFDQLITEEASEEKIQKINAVVHDINELIPSLDSMGMFDFFTPIEWLQDGEKQPGRALVALLYLQANPAKLKDNVRHYLPALREICVPDLIPFIDVLL